MKTQLAALLGRSSTCARTGPVPGRKPVLALLVALLWAAALALPTFGAQAGVVFTSLCSFRVLGNGLYPQAGLAQGSDGYFYGTTYFGGTYGYGNVFKMSVDGALTSLYSFTGGNDGSTPVAALVQGSDGNFYGTTEQGGTNDAGTVFKISATGALTSLYSFTGGNDGANPYAGLVQGSDGCFYGTTEQGGTNDYGTVFKISTNGTLTSLYSFTGGNDGSTPVAALVQGSDGYFYGTTQGGTHGYGNVFKISDDGAPTSLYSFTGGNDGSTPVAALVQGSDGNFYGTTEQGGTNDAGTVFKISATGALTSLYSFTGGNDGANPYAGLVQGSDGYFYGTSSEDGANGYGIVFKISATGALTSLYSFGSVQDTNGLPLDGANPAAALVQGSDGYFYGTTEAGGTTNHNTDSGTYGEGTVFKISANGALTSLYPFTIGNEGYGPNGLVQGSDGYFYGTTQEGGTNSGYGTVFKVSATGALTSLYSFTGGNDGTYPNGLVQGSDGYFYGTTEAGGTANYDPDPGTFGYGTVFKISTNGALTSLYSFTGGNDGSTPLAGLVQGSDGYFYGTTEAGGTANYDPDSGTFGYGTVFKISANGVLTTLYAFGTVTNAHGGPLDGANPEGGLVQGGDGYFYGTTQDGGTNGDGTVFKISANGTLTSLHSFTGRNDGEYPMAGLVQGSDGCFYGTTSAAGTNGYGTVFKISANGTLTSLHSFTGGNDGENPAAALVQGSDGYFYGTTPGFSHADIVISFDIPATVFKISTNGVLTSLDFFWAPPKNGNVGLAGLVKGSDGSFYGTTSSSGGGPPAVGWTVFRMTVVPEFQPLTLSNGTLNLTWTTEAGGKYQLQYNTDLSSSNWVNLGSAATATGATLSATDSVTNGPRRFYQLKQITP